GGWGGGGGGGGGRGGGVWGGGGGGGGAGAGGVERRWWRRAPAVLVAPRAVFVSLRDESTDALDQRQEPLTAIAGLAGIAGVLGTPVARHLLNDGSISPSLIPVWAFFGGVVYGLA